ncbi:enoyl-CoA hydratase/isomerase family protein [Paracoccus sp. TK19116]|uniref:3-hydroxyisobutyryl-CoA hydrolase n=1 Tax=Paracoccus albicereus TaxID=2922394 RepID=A0ABT1MWJ0_9RHOB|nr:enoyl-CoA hydratase/isomerase family protein [Paracoccus albicereus]MCQ0971703.1 enoyl-CoA hydratase/isomerase family protein [Paracoccus albicereus]
MEDLIVRKSGRAGRITLNRPQAMNALTREMVQGIHAALRDWRDDAEVDLVVIDGAGERAFCAGGDIAALYQAAQNGDHETGRTFFRDEYAMNAAIADYPKPVVVLLHGFVMGGGVGIGGHASHRIVGDSTRMSMPEAGIGLIPDVGGTWLLARAPGRIGEYLALTGARIGAGDAIYAGLADSYIPEDAWPGLIAELERSGDTRVIKGSPPPDSPLADRDLSVFGRPDVEAIRRALRDSDDDATLSLLESNSPLSMAAGLMMVRAARDDERLQDALSREYRFTHRATQEADFLEGVRAALIDRDRTPDWQAAASEEDVAAILSPLGDHELTWEDET